MDAIELKIAMLEVKRLEHFALKKAYMEYPYNNDFNLQARIHEKVSLDLAKEIDLLKGGRRG